MSVYHAEYRRRVLRYVHTIVAITQILVFVVVGVTACTPAVFRIGVIAPLSGTLTDRGLAYKRGAELAAEEHSGRFLRIELATKDSRNSHLVAQRIAQELIFESAVEALLAPPAPALADAVLSIRGLPIITTELVQLFPCQFSLALSEKVREHARILFIARRNPPVDGESALEVDSAADHSHYRALLYHADDPRRIVQRFVEGFRIRYGVYPELFAAFGYDAVSLLVSLRKKSRTNSDICAELSSSGGSFAGTTGEVRWNQTGLTARYARTIGITDTSQNRDQFLGRLEVGVDQMVGN